MVASHTHWCYKGKHFIHNCDCPLELPVNVACVKCLKQEDRQKDLDVEKFLQKIIDADPQGVIRP